MFGAYNILKVFLITLKEIQVIIYNGLYRQKFDGKV